MEQVYNIPQKFKVFDVNLIQKELKIWILSLYERIDSIKPNETNSLFLIGDVGVGKTAILYFLQSIIPLLRIKTIIDSMFAKEFSKDQAYALAANCESQFKYYNKSIKLLTFSELIKDLRNIVTGAYIGDVHGYTRVEEGKPLPIHLIDDFGRGYEDKAGWNLSLLEEYFDLRWRYNLPTIITTNLTPEMLNDLEGWDRIVDRLADKTWMKHWVIPGKSKRRV